MSNVRRYFDESVFDDVGFTLKSYDSISVTNRADEWLIQKLGKIPIKSSCTRLTNKSGVGDIPTEKIANLNPHIPCIGTNLYSLDNYALESLIVVPFYQVTVTNSNGTQILNITDEFDEAAVFTNNSDLTPFESAIMIKYYSKKKAITIDHKLYELIHKFVKNSSQKLFRFEDEFIRRKLITDQYRHNVINFDYTSPAIPLN